MLFTAHTHDTLLVFTQHGRVYALRAYEIPEVGPAARGRPLVNLLRMGEGERVLTVMPVKDFESGGYIFMATERGRVKKTAMSEFASIRSTGKRAIQFEPGDVLVAARPVTEEDARIVLATRNGQSICFPHTDVRAMGREARGVRGIRLAEKDRVVSLAVLPAHGGPDILTVTELGYVKRTPADFYRVQARGGKGVRNLRVTTRNGPMVDGLVVEDGDQLVVITQGGQILRTEVSQVRRTGRDTQGVRLMNLAEEDRVVGVARVPAENLDDEEA